MGGSGSTGSSLLRIVLNRHETVFSGEELSFFNKEQYFQDWPRYRRGLLGPFRRQIATRGWFAYPGHGLLNAEYLWTGEALREVIRQSDSIVAFSQAFFARPLERTGARLWMEKTPSNAYSFRAFLEAFPRGVVIHTARDPLDASASLVNRGMAPFHAAALYLYNTACALAVAQDPRYHLVKYEDLTTDPRGTVEALCTFLGIPFDPAILAPNEGEKGEESRNPGWRFSGSDAIQTARTRTFDLLPEGSRKALLELFSLLEISPRHSADRALPHTTPAQIFRALDYQVPRVEAPDPGPYRKALLKDMASRTLRRYPTGLGYYPVSL